MQSGMRKHVEQHCEVLDFINYRSFLAEVYQKCRDFDKKYSYRKFSEDLGFSKTNALLRIVNGERNLGEKGIGSVCEALGLKKLKRQFFAALVKFENAREMEQREKNLAKLKTIRQKAIEDEGGRKSLEFFGEWYHPIINELVSKKTFYDDPAWIASRLYRRILPQQIKHSLKLLTELNFIQWSEQEHRYLPAKLKNRVAEKVVQFASVFFHQEMIDMAKHSLTTTPDELRDVNAVTISIRKDDITKLREMIATLCENALELEKQGDSESADIFQLNVQLFPLTTGINEKKGDI